MPPGQGLHPPALPKQPPLPVYLWGSDTDNPAKKLCMPGIPLASGSQDLHGLIHAVSVVYLAQAAMDFSPDVKTPEVLP